MCGIAGQIALGSGGPVSLDDVHRMTDEMTHRGPDDEGFFLDGARRVALGMRRLSIIDVATGQQPVFTEDRSVACVLNGEIYNFRALRQELEAKGHIFKSASDTEALAHLYEEYGLESLRRLRGMFAFAIWDARTDTLVVARDPLGKKPLYYAEYDGRLSFASEISALTALPGVPRDLDPTAVDLYLTYSYIPAPYSIFRGVRKLPPAHVMTVRQGRVTIERYWAIEDCEPLRSAKEDLLAQVRGALRDAVRVRLVSDVPLGCFLSGGVDSSSVVALMSELSAKPVSTFSIGFADEEFNELEHARTVARHFGTDHHEFVVSPDAVEVLPQIVRHFGEPFGDSSAIPTWYLAKVARQHVTVALNGDGGDELFAGYDWYRSARTLDRLGRALPGLIARGLSAAPTAGFRVGTRLRRVGERLRMEPAERFTSLRRFLSEDVKTRLYGQELLAARGQAAERYLPEHYEQAGGRGLWKYQQTDITTYLAEDLLVKVDRMTMAHSMEGRSPLLDQELLALCARIPERLKVDSGGGKALLRQAMGPMFPKRFFDRPKMGFSVPLARWLREDLRGECYGKVCGSVLGRVGWIRADTARTMLDEHCSGRRDWSAQIWNLLVLAEWAESARV
jgi:asparagine synthase (glutamine-hydrolysing)